MMAERGMTVDHSTIAPDAVLRADSESAHSTLPLRLLLSEVHSDRL
jgi:hypothetical protein